MANNKWKSIWEKRKANMNILRGDDIRSIVLELKRCDGFDVVGGDLLTKRYCVSMNRLRRHFL